MDRVATTLADSTQVGGNHYKKMSIQHWTFCLANNIPYMEGQIIKYVSRWRDKNGIEDLRKAQHYLAKLIEYEEEQRVAKTPLADSGKPGSGYVDQGKD